MMSTFLTLMHAGLDALCLDVSRDDFLSAVAILHAPDPLAEARLGPETLTLDALHRVAWGLGLDLHVSIVPRLA